MALAFEEGCRVLMNALLEIKKEVQPEKDCLVCACNDDVPCGVCMERARISGIVENICKRVLP